MGWGGKRPGAGRPRKQPIRERVKLSKMLTYADAEAALKLLREVVADPQVDERVRVVAAKEILDRKYGKPTSSPLDEAEIVSGGAVVRIE